MTVERLRPFAETVFATMTAKAVEFEAVNLGQGFPDTGGPAAMLERAQREIASGNNQYAPGRGVADLRRAIAAQRARDYGQRFDPDTEVLVTVGATEAIAASVLGLVEPGSEVIVLDPSYDAYGAAVALAGAHLVSVPLVADGASWRIDENALEAAVTDRTAMVIVNSPHNPTGAQLDLAGVARVCVRHDLLALSDEVYEHLLYDARVHRPLALEAGMRERTVTVSSAAKTFSATGWKTGWAMAPAPLLDGVHKAKQFMTFVGATPFQPAVAYALDNEDEWVRGQAESLGRRRTMLANGLEEAGFRVHDSHGTYFLVAELPEAYPGDGVEFCLALPEKAGVAAIPVQVFCADQAPWSRLVRFAFCRREEALREAVKRLKAVDFAQM
ncbi:aminotransferase [Corynebacterium frankenforstense DSM 45800]|uniref:Aminotransferase n=1 Tax=Corynebacterium frankenforstense DSM 45800 TaxID=1437875 RepID=A0A1L7CRK3_9CORY|nr:pyridoxal phosphate-dependent aminotransferase [Corynebacterium frankenforstense]APT88462.1 aminotransferase [Corynebacterium frankenforstense DSM 45800]